MAYKSTHWLFRDLTDAEEAEFRQAARTKYKPGVLIPAQAQPPLAMAHSREQR